MRGSLSFCLLVCLPIAAQQAPIPTATELSGNPFFVKQSWPIGGAGNWDYLTMDPAARRLYIAHGRKVQVVDVESGTVEGEIAGFSEAHQIALDDSGTYGYVSDGRANAVDVFDRGSLKVEAFIMIHCSPRSIAYEPRSKFVFAICGANAPPARSGEIRAQLGSNAFSHIVAIDAEKKSVTTDIIVPGDFRFAQADGDGNIYISVGPGWRRFVIDGHSFQQDLPSRLARLDATAIASEVQKRLSARPDLASVGSVRLDWSGDSGNGTLWFFGLGSACNNPQGLAADSRHQRIFLTCDDQRFLVLDSETGKVLATLTTGPGDDMLAYDQDRRLIFIANGSGYGSLTIVRQDQTTDSYAIIQNLPTMERARTIAVDSSTGEVYLVTDLHGVDLTRMGGIGTLRFDPVPGSFQVLVVGH